MSAGMDRAIAALNDRGEAMAAGAVARAVDVEGGGDMATVNENPDEFCRRFLNGFVAPEEMDHALNFIKQATAALRNLTMGNPNPAARIATTQTMIAQMMVVGVVLERSADALDEGDEA